MTAEKRGEGHENTQSWAWVLPAFPPVFRFQWKSNQWVVNAESQARRLDATQAVLCRRQKIGNIPVRANFSKRKSKWKRIFFEWCDCWLLCFLRVTIFKIRKCFVKESRMSLCVIGWKDQTCVLLCKQIAFFVANCRSSIIQTPSGSGKRFRTGLV